MEETALLPRLKTWVSEPNDFMKRIYQIFPKKRHNEFHRINNTYSNFERFMLKNGRMMSKETEHGYWGTTPLKDLITLFEALDLDKAKNFCDLGSGDGRIALTASLFNVKKVIGIESDPWLHRVSNHMKNHIDIDHFWKVKFRNDNFEKHNIKGYDYVYMSPDQPFHRGTEKKLKNEMGKGKLIVHSYEFLPESLKLLQTFSLNGEKFSVFCKE